MRNWILFSLFTTLFWGCNFGETEDTSGSLFSGHRVVENSFTVTAPSDGIYLEDDVITFRLKHPYSLTVTGTPRISLDIGGSSVFATYVSGSASKTLTFSYTVTAGLNDADGVTLGNTIDLNGGTIKFEGTAGAADATLSISSPSTPGVIVDTSGPSIASITAPLPLTYYVGQKMQFLVTFDQDVYVTGSPKLPIDIGGTTQNATYLSGSGGTSLLFQYTVVATDMDTNGIQITSPIGLNSGTIKDEGGNAATLTFANQNEPTVLVDGDTPLVQTFIPPADGTYQPGDALEFSLRFSEVVNVTGSPRVGVDIGGNIRYAMYASGSGSDTLVFRYSIVSGNEDDDGVDVENIIELNGGTIRDAGARNAYLLMDAPKTPGALVDATLPAVTSITLPSPPADEYFNSGEEIYITLNFNDVIDVSGFPQLGMTLASSGATIYIDYNSGSGTSSLVFRYVVVDEVDEDHDGFELVSPLNLNGGTIQNAQLTNADLDISTAIAALDTSLMLVDATTPTITSITPPADDTYAIGEQVNFTLNFSEIVNVTGSPRFAMDIGGSTRYATYVSGTGSAALTFRWTVQNNYEDTDGIQITSSAILPNGGLIEDRGGNPANYDISGVLPNLAAVFIDGIRPNVTSVTIPAGTYAIGQTVTATVVFDDTVNVAGGAPTITGTFNQAGGGTNFTYQTGTGSATLTFDYVVVAGDEDLDGIALAASISLGGATITDINGNNANLPLSATSFPAVLLDAVGPSIAITGPVNGDYINQSSDSATYAVAGTCDDAGATYDIQINGASAPGQLGVSCDGANFSGTFNTTGLGQVAFTLTVEATDASANNTSSNAVSLTKDTVAPSITSVTPPANANYTFNSNVDFTVNFDEAVTVSGSRIAITAGASTVYASYNSGSGGSTPVYRYTVSSTDYDNDGIAVSSPLELNGGSITDIAGNNANLAFAPPATGSITFNDGTPAFQWYDSGMNPVAAYDYQTPLAPTTEVFTIENTGTAPTSVSFQVGLNSGIGDFQIAADNCSGNVIGINDTCTVSIDFRNIGGSGVKNGQAQADDPGRAPNPGYTLDLQGTKP